MLRTEESLSGLITGGLLAWHIVIKIKFLRPCITRCRLVRLRLYTNGKD